MKFESTTEKLSAAVYRAEKISGKNLSLPILSGILIEAKGKLVSVRSTNLDVGIDVKIPASVSESGIAVVPGGALSNFLSNISGDKNVSVESSESALNVSTKKNKAQIKVYPPKEFPKMPASPTKGSVSLDSKLLSKGLKSVWYSASLSSMKPELSSVYVGYNSGNLVFAATDSFRLSEKRIPAKGLNKFDSLLIPLKNVGEIIRNLETSGGPVKLSFDEHQLELILDDGTKITSRVIDGTFPDYAQIIPKSFETEATLLKQDLIDALKISNVFSNKFNQISVTADPKKKKFIIETNNPELGESKVSVDSALSGDEISIGFNHRYITDVFQSIESDSVTLQFSGIGKPMVIRAVGDSTFMYLVMPMNR